MKRCRFPLFLIGEIHNCRKESGLSKRGVNVAAKKAEKNSAIQKKFYISQIETTKRIIKTFSETTEFSPAMLINSLLSLVILPYERAKESGGGRIFPGKYPDLIRKFGISPQIFTPIQSCSNGDVVYNRKTIYTFVNKFRNGIAHQNLEISVDNYKHIYIVISNKFSCKSCRKCKTKKCSLKGLQRRGNTVTDFQIQVTVEELQKIALYIADAYIKAISP